MNRPELVIYSKTECCLCDAVKQTAAPLARRHGVALRIVEIEGNEELCRRFEAEIPVGFLNGRKIFKYRIGEAELEDKLQRAASSV